jgi:hypothetical protein
MRLLLIPFFLLAILVSTNADTLLKEDFDSMENWEALSFDKIERHSTYEVKDSILIAKSDNSASGIKFKKNYDIFQYPVLKFSWKINNVYKKGDALKKDGDDYPIRIYVMFKYNSKKAGFWESMKYDLAKSIYGEYPPHSSLNYIWSNKVQKDRIITSAYTDKAKMVVLDSSNTHLNQYRIHEVNILDDYIEAFGKNPPRNVSIAIMTDSDNTHENSLSYIDYIEVKSE